MATTTKLKTPKGSLRVTENDIERPYDGGRIVLVADNGEFAKTADNPSGDKLSEDMKIMGITVIINYRKDDPMKEWPSTKEDMEKKRYVLTITEEK